MKYSRNIIATVLISLFILNGICSVVPRLFTGCENAIEKLYSTESETEKKETNERTVSETKEWYVSHSCPSDLFIIYLNITEQNNTLADILLLDDIHISIPTPPPETT